MFEVADDRRTPGVFLVSGTGGFAGQSATFSGPEARTRAEAYALWMNAGAALQRRRTDPGFKARVAAAKTHSSASVCSPAP